jgi:hypothetical protein
MESFNAQKHLKGRQTRPLQPALAGRETYEFARPALSSIGMTFRPPQQLVNNDRVTRRRIQGPP